MAFNITDFKSQISLGLARPNLFQWQMSFPAAINSGTAGQKLTFMTKDAELPGSLVEPVPVPYFGRVVYVAGDRRFDPITITVMNDEDFAVRDVFERWLNAIKQHEENSTTLPNLLDYQSDGKVQQFSKDKRVIKEYTFTGMMPYQVSPIRLAWEANNQIELFTVSLVYTDWRAVGVTS